MHKVYIGLGTNLGDRLGNIQRAVQAIGDLPDNQAVEMAPIYQTPPMGPQDQSDYLNTAVSLETTYTPTQLLGQLQQIEASLGRAPLEDRQHWGPRVIDLDILLVDDLTLTDKTLQVPHPGMADRWFVLKPLADLNPALIHPTLGRSILQLLQALPQDQAGECFTPE